MDGWRRSMEKLRFFWMDDRQKDREEKERQDFKG